MSLLATIFLDLWASYASWGKLIGERDASASCPSHQKEAKDDTSDEQPPSDIEGDRYAVLGLRTVIEDLVRPLLGGQHSDGRENIQDVDKEVLKHNDVEPHVPGGERGGLETANVYIPTVGATYLDRISHELFVNSLVSIKSNCVWGQKAEYMRATERGNQGGARTLWSGTFSRFHRGPLPHIVGRFGYQKE